MITGTALVTALWLRVPVRLLAALAAATGLAAGWLAHQYLDPRFDPGPMALLVGLVTGFPRTAAYAVGFAFAWRLAGDYGRDASSGWTQQYLAAGGTRDRYVVALTIAEALHAVTAFVIAVGAWSAVVSLGGGGGAPWLAVSRVVVPGSLWIAGACALMALLVCVTLRPGTAQALLLLLYLGPLVALAMSAMRNEAPPALAIWLFRLTPPAGLHAGPDALFLAVLYVALALGAGWLLSDRALRVR